MRERTFPTGATIIRPKNLHNVEIGIYTSSKTNKPCAIGYRGKKTNPDFRYRFLTETEREQHITKFIEECGKLEEYRAVNRESRKARTSFDVNPVEVGTIFSSSWGWEQTNVDFYQVVAVSGSFVTIREIASDLTSDGNQSMSGKVMPIRDHFIGEDIRKKVLTYDSGKTVSLKMTSYAYAYIWDGKTGTHNLVRLIFKYLPLFYQKQEQNTMENTLTWDDVLKEIGVTRNTIYLWEKANKIPKAKRDRNGSRIFTTEWVKACVQFRDKVQEAE